MDQDRIDDGSNTLRGAVIIEGQEKVHEVTQGNGKSRRPNAAQRNEFKKIIFTPTLLVNFSEEPEDKYAQYQTKGLIVGEGIGDEPPKF